MADLRRVLRPQGLVGGLFPGIQDARWYHQVGMQATFTFLFFFTTALASLTRSF